MENSLISAIFRKLPLKWLLVILAVGGVLFASFSSAGMIITNYEYTEKVTSKEFAIGNYDLVCVYNKNCTNGNFCFRNDINNTQGKCINFNINEVGGLGNCGTTSADVSTVNTCSYGVNYIKFNNYTSLQCQTEYNLIPISSVDSEYCTTNNLCPSSGTPSDCPNVGVSNLFINDIFHPGAFNIIMNIPEEIEREYAYTNSGNNFNLDVIGYNQDTEYINGLIDINNYQPTSEDFTNTFLLFKEYGGLLLACLFVILVFYLIKKAFK